MPAVIRLARTMKNVSSKPIVLKVGGALLAMPDAMETFWTSVAALREQTSVVIVHGGGPQATEVARRLRHEPRIVHGRRVTSDVDLEIVQWTLRGALNTSLVAGAAQHGLAAVGLSGADGGTLHVTRRPPWEIDGETVDFGWVGDVEGIDVRLVEMLLGGGFVPVLSPLGLDAAGLVYNVNADTVACAVAQALEASAFLLVTESGGVRRDAGNAGSRLDQCDQALFEQGVAEGWIAGGMRVKLHVAFQALEAGIADVAILSPDSLLSRANATAVV